LLRREELEKLKKETKERRASMHLHLNRSTRWLAGFIFLFLSQPTHCGLPTVNFEAAEIPPAIVITAGKTSQGFPYLFGGVSSDEREAMEERAKTYNVKIVFAEKGGAYLSGVVLTITSAKNAEILSHLINGPWFYIELPEGNYGVKASFNGRTQLTRFEVRKGKTVHQTLNWDVSLQ
jgi:hypothetical protein